MPDLHRQQMPVDMDLADPAFPAETVVGHQSSETTVPGKPRPRTRSTTSSP